MKTLESPRVSPSATERSIEPVAVRLMPTKIQATHQDRLAVVYVRQSTPQQVLENRESTARQYALAGLATAWGWPTPRVLVIDEDQGQSGRSADHRAGFQRLLAEVTMDHVGLILGLEMSRLARSNKDWHHLLELCALFGTLLADQDGVYDPSDPNDRLLLGLKGTMSEVELHTMRNRLDRGRLHKAQRGELFHTVPFGYVKLPHGNVDKDPDAQAQSVVELLFAKFTEIGSLYGLFHYLVEHGIELPMRVQGQLDWRRPSLPSLSQTIRNPIYAGAYAYGRRPVNPKIKYGGGGKRSSPWLPMDQWKVLLKDRVPAYITWEQFLQNQERLRKNRTGPGTPGTPRPGCALLPGLLVCGNCGRQLHVSYRHKNFAQYGCVWHIVEAREQTCYGMAAAPLDALVAQQVLRALEPAALTLSIQARADIQRERERLGQQWRQRLERARYDVELAERRYRAVDPSNRLVASTLEKNWEETLRQQQHIQEEHDRFTRETPAALTAEEEARITALANDIPALWHAAGTPNTDRQAIIRCLIERVVVHVRHDSEYVDTTIHWAGGYTSQHQVRRPVRTYGQLEGFEELMDRVVALRQAGYTTRRIAEQLDAEGFRPPRCRGAFNAAIVQQMLYRRGLIGNERAANAILQPGECWLADLAGRVGISLDKLRDWVRRGWLHARRTPIQGYWIAWADEDEVERLRRLLAESRRGVSSYPPSLTTPKPRRRAKHQKANP
ncbi:MAG TPA: recombinase family protein [Gemmataceae bacterium]|jgi:DNA invertase Pin-like site-specific DNA recombinase|nr:recombinase family protein [Gemmataceae bacterium]